MPQRKELCFVITREGLGELPRPSALRKRLMHFPFEIIIWNTKGILEYEIKLLHFTGCRHHG
jgi:hypothetical protein